MKNLLLIIAFLIAVACLTSCGEPTTDYYYRVKSVSTGIKFTVKDTEIGKGVFGSYNNGDTLHVYQNYVTKNAKYPKCVVVSRIK